MEIVTFRILSKANHKVNEDVARVTRRAAWVIDGATGLTNRKFTSYSSDARWFVKKMDYFFKGKIDTDPKNLKKLVINAIKSISKEYTRITSGVQVGPADSPSGSVAIVRIANDELEYLVLGDCCVIIQQKGRTMVITDLKHKMFDDKAIKEMHRIQVKKGIGWKDARTKINPLLVKHRCLKNTPRGYWVLDLDTTAVRHALYGRIPLTGDCDILLMSDGFSRIVDTFKKFNNCRELVNFVNRRGLKKAFSILRKLETADPDCLMYPRLAPHDDASAVWIKITNH